MDSEFKVAEIAPVLHALKIYGRDDLFISGLAFDTRSIAYPEKTLFFALKSTQDGHNYIPNAYKLGVRNFVVSQWQKKWEQYQDATFIEVRDTQQALQSLASWHRSRYNIPVIAITGSNGKTIVKEWLSQLLSSDYNIVRSPKSYNSQIGVPISVWGIQSHHNLAIFEAGISKKGEMEFLERIIQPQIGILTNIGNAHDEGFDTHADKLADKLKLFAHTDVLIYCPDFLPSSLDGIPTGKTFTYSFQDETTDLFLYEVVQEAKCTRIGAIYRNQKIYITIPFVDTASVRNASTCWATMLYLGYKQEDIATRMMHLSPIDMRLELKQGINDCIVIDDSYSCDLASLQIALRFLQQQTQYLKKTVILSDIVQSGLDTHRLYHEVANLLSINNVNRLIGIGSEIEKYRCFFEERGIEVLFFKTNEQILEQLPVLQFQHEGILIKGARQFHFEQISRALVQKQHQTVMHVNLNALLYNLNCYRGLLREGVKTMAMVKAFSYGSGTYEIANLLQYHHVDYLCVAYADEGVSLREAQIRLPIMVMNPDEAIFETLYKYDLEPEIFTKDLLVSFIAFLNQKTISEYSIHLKIDTGMKRLGFEKEDITSLIQILCANPRIKVKSVFSHLVASDDSSLDEFTQHQINLFSSVCQQLQEGLGYSFIKHICNTSGVARWKNAHFDMVRLGIGLYGIDACMKQFHLQPVVSLKTTIAQIKEVHSNETIGYSRKGNLAHGGKTATVKIGYADGYLRKLGNGKAYMLVDGKKAPIVGNICMDMCMIDITEIANAREGDEVTVIGETILVEQLAKWLDTIPYEVLTNISQRVKRVYQYE